MEINYNGTWGTVCDDNWDLPDAEVVCRQLGFDGAIEALSNAYFGAGADTMPILLDDVICFGNELMLSQCLLPPVGRHNCRHYEDAGVRCYRKSILFLVFQACLPYSGKFSRGPIFMVLTDNHRLTAKIIPT